MSVFQPEWANDGVVVVTDVDLDWKDRLYLLLFGRVTIRTETATEHEVGRCESRAEVSVYRPRFRRQAAGMVAEPEPLSGADLEGEKSNPAIEAGRENIPGDLIRGHAFRRVDA